MTISGKKHSVTAIVAAALLTATVGAAAAQEHAPTSSRVQVQAQQLGRASTAVQQGKPALFIGETKESKLLIFDARSRLIAQRALPNWKIATDVEGYLYVTTYFTKPYVTILSPPAYAYANGIKVPLSHNFLAVGLAVDARSGVYAVIARQSINNGGASLVSFYRRGETSPCNTLYNNNGINDFDGSAAFDRSGRLYLAINNQSGDTLASIAGGCKATVIEQLTFVQQPFIPYVGFGFSADDNLVIQLASAQPGEVYTYAHPKNGQFGPPLIVTQLKPRKDQKYDPGLVCLASDARHLWGAQSDEAGHFNEVGLFAYPQGGTAITTIRGVTASTSVAVFPPLMPSHSPTIAERVQMARKSRAAERRTVGVLPAALSPGSRGPRFRRGSRAVARRPPP